MTKVKIACFEVAPWEREYLRRRLSRRADVVLTGDPVTAETVTRSPRCQVLSVFIYSHLTREFLGAFPQLRLIATRSTGYDHIDLATCRRRKIVVANVPSYGENTVAEHTFALILSLSRNIHKAYVKTIHSDFSLEGLRGFDLKGKTIGVVGAGHIGLHVIKMAKGFGMEVVACEARRNPFLAEVLDFRYVDLDDLLAMSDIVTLHLPHTTATHHLIDRRRIGHMKRGVLLINTARGGLVDTTALVWGLDQGIVGGAGLDVLEEEELVKEERQLLSKDFPKAALERALQTHILLHRENVVITPHIAFNSREALQRILETSVANIEAFLAGHPQNTVTVNQHMPPRSAGRSPSRPRGAVQTAPRGHRGRRRQRPRSQSGGASEGGTLGFPLRGLTPPRSVA